MNFILYCNKIITVQKIINVHGVNKNFSWGNFFLQGVTVKPVLGTTDLYLCIMRPQETTLWYDGPEVVAIIGIKG